MLSNNDIINGATSCSKCTNGNKVTVNFVDDTYTFWSQWLHDARYEEGPSRNARTAMSRQPLELVQVEKVDIAGKGADAKLNVTWKNGDQASFPLVWLKVMAPMVAAQPDSKGVLHSFVSEKVPRGWTVDDLKIPEISYSKLFGEDIDAAELAQTTLSILDIVLGASAPGIVKIVDLPEPNMEDEHKTVNNIVTAVLKRLFGSVWVHPVRGADKTFNVSSHGHSSSRKVNMSNYDTDQLLLPHNDHTFYVSPIQVQGFYGLEGTSENTWLSALKALETLQEEHPDSYEDICRSPVSYGRITTFYGDPIFQATMDSPVTTVPGFPGQVKRVRWHPNLMGYLCSDYDKYKAHRVALQRFQEIMRRPSHQLKITLNPGDLYIWDNFRLLHGREKVLTTPRTACGQTVPEDVVQDRYRALCVNAVKDHVGRDWLCHLPMDRLRELVDVVAREKVAAKAR